MSSRAGRPDDNISPTTQEAAVRAWPEACVTAWLGREVCARKPTRTLREHCGKGATAESAAVSYASAQVRVERGGDCVIAIPP